MNSLWLRLAQPPCAYNSIDTLQSPTTLPKPLLSPLLSSVSCAGSTYKILWTPTFIITYLQAGLGEDGRKESINE